MRRRRQGRGVEVLPLSKTPAPSPVLAVVMPIFRSGRRWLCNGGRRGDKIVVEQDKMAVFTSLEYANNSG